MYIKKVISDNIRNKREKNWTFDISQPYQLNQIPFPSDTFEVTKELLLLLNSLKEYDVIW